MEFQSKLKTKLVLPMK